MFIARCLSVLVAITVASGDGRADDEVANASSRATPSVSPTPLTGDSASRVSAGSGLTDRSAETNVESTLKQLRFLQQQVDAMLPAAQRTVVGVGGGSGVIVSPSGIVLTAAHVAGRRGQSHSVRLANGVVWPASTFATDTKSDLGLIQLAGSVRWPCTAIRQLSGTHADQWVVALGYPLSFERGKPSVVRLGQIATVSDNRIRTDCVIMGGDSGGPLLDTSGSLLAINSRIKLPLDQNYHVPAYHRLHHWLKTNSDLRLQKAFNKLRFVSREAARTETGFASTARSLDSAAALLAQLDKQVVTLIKSNGSRCLGTVVQQPGLVVAALDCLDGPRLDPNVSEAIVCQLQNGEQFPMKLLGVEPSDNLALLRIEADHSFLRQAIEPVQWSEKGRTVDKAAGQIAGAVRGESFSPDKEIRSVAFGNIISPFGKVAVPSANFCDVGLIVENAQSLTWQTASNNRINRGLGARVSRVYPGSTGGKLDIQRNDFLLTFNGNSVTRQSQLRQLAAELNAGDKVVAQLVRDGKLTTVSGTIDRAQTPTIYDRWGGGPFSEKRFGFDSAIPHCIPLHPNDCGGPLVDLNGKCLGVNVARASRVASYAIPADRLIDFIRRFEPQAKLSSPD